MTTQDFETKSFDELIEQLNEEREDIYTREDLMEMTKYEIDEDNLFIAQHILNGLMNEYAEWYKYDRTMGTLVRVVALQEKEDIEDLIWD